jgi:hypothetical protein
MGVGLAALWSLARLALREIGARRGVIEPSQN